MSKPQGTPPGLILASGSPYRRTLLERLGLPFEVLSPDIDETARDGEPAGTLVRRLADEKAAAVRARRPGAVIVASDQLACLDGSVLGKPGDAATAREQLRRCSGSEVNFLTAVTVLGPRGGQAARHLDLTRVLFRPLTDARIDAYLDAEKPFDCAGSFKCEGLGICLFERIASSDPTALIGLPLIFTADALRAAGFALP